jgi:hypothetical protein
MMQLLLFSGKYIIFKFQLFFKMQKKLLLNIHFGPIKMPLLSGKFDLHSRGFIAFFSLILYTTVPRVIISYRRIGAQLTAVNIDTNRKFKLCFLCD